MDRTRELQIAIGALQHYLRLAGKEIEQDSVAFYDTNCGVVKTLDGWSFRIQLLPPREYRTKFGWPAPSMMICSADLTRSETIKMGDPLPDWAEYVLSLEVTRDG